jgi:prepilin-type N-terminal cleavage/methylation domain-containing protein
MKNLSKGLSRAMGFSLVELLVVVSVVGVLLALLLPSLGKARETARKALCLSKIRQQMVMVHTYQVDFGVILPAQYYTHTSILGQHIHAIGLDVLYRQYSQINELKLSAFTDVDMEKQRARSLMACPSGKVFYPTAASTFEDRKIQSGLFRADPSGAWLGFVYDYTISIGPTTRYEGAPGFRYFATKRIRGADSQTLYMLEASLWPTTTWSDFRQQGINMATGGWWRGRMPHSETTNFACYDGHAGSVTINDYRAAASMGFSQPTGFLPFRID